MKSPLRFLVGAFLIFAMAGAMAADREHQSADEFIKSLPPVQQSASPFSRENLVVEGDLNGDGLSDRAIIVGQDQPRLYVLLQTVGHAFRLAVSSQAGTLDERESVTARIEKGSLYVSVGMDGTALQGSYDTQYQFKFYKGAWRMIRLTHNESAADYAPTPSGGVSTHMGATDINLLTGDIAVSESTSDDEGEHSQSKHYKATVRHSCLLADFAFISSPCLDDWKTREGHPVTVDPVIFY